MLGLHYMSMITLHAYGRLLLSRVHLTCWWGPYRQVDFDGYGEMHILAFRVEVLQPQQILGAFPLLQGQQVHVGGQLSLHP